MSTPPNFHSHRSTGPVHPGIPIDLLLAGSPGHSSLLILSVPPAAFTAAGHMCPLESLCDIILSWLCFTLSGHFFPSIFCKRFLFCLCLMLVSSKVLSSLYTLPSSIKHSPPKSLSATQLSLLSSRLKPSNTCWTTPLGYPMGPSNATCPKPNSSCPSKIFSPTLPVAHRHVLQLSQHHRHLPHRPSQNAERRLALFHMQLSNSDNAASWRSI